jgi:hypothetical protein
MSGTALHKERRQQKMLAPLLVRITVQTFCIAASQPCIWMRHPRPVCHDALLSVTHTVGPVDEQGLEGVVGQLGQGLYHQIRRQFAVRRADADGAHARPARALDSSRRIFDHDAAGWRYGNPLGGKEEDLGIRFAALYVFSRNQRIETPGHL